MPDWFKFKAERAELIRQLPPDSLKTVLLSALDYLATRQKPEDLPVLESLAFAAFLPDCEEAWQRCETNARNGGRKKATGSDRYRLLATATDRHQSVPTGVEQTRAESDKESDAEGRKKRAWESGAAEPPAHTQFSLPSVSDVREYCMEQGLNIDPERFVDYYGAIGWQRNGSQIRDWRALVRIWARRGEQPQSAGNHQPSFSELADELERPANKSQVEISEIMLDKMGTPT